MEKKFNFAISLFERLVINGINYDILENQRKLRPVFAYFIREIYEKNSNHHISLPSFNDIKGIRQNLFFFDHDNEETQLTRSKKINKFETLFILTMTRYLILQGYQQEQISIICWDFGQSILITESLRRLNLTKIIVSTVDNYQGEENDIVIISLVGSYPANKFEANKIGVALSRARIGMYVLGNFKGLCKSENGSIWQKIVDIAESKDCLGKFLTITCQNHKNEIIIERPEHFLKNPEGGCLELCNITKPCGHIWF